MNKIEQVDKIIEQTKKKLNLLEELKKAIQIEDLKKKHGGGNLFSCTKDNVKLLFFKKDENRGLTIAISNVIFDAYKKGLREYDWNSIKEFIRKNNISYEGSMLKTQYEQEIMDNINIVEMVEA